MHCGSKDIFKNAPCFMCKYSYDVTDLVNHGMVKFCCIDLILTNIPRGFQSIYVIETGLSDFHLMTLTVMIKNFKKIKPRSKL